MDVRALPAAFTVVTLGLFLAACPPQSTTTGPTPDPVVGSCDGCQVVRHVRVLDVNSAREDMRVSMRDGRILDIHPDDGALSGAARELDGSGRTLLPGLWDMHAHLTLQGGGPGVEFPPAIPRNLMAHLQAGVTNVFDLGSPRDAILAWRNRTRTSQLLAPRLFATGPFFTAPLGHPCLDEYDAQSCVPTQTLTEGLAWLSALAPLSPDAVKVVVEPGLSPAAPAPSLDTTTVLPALLQAAQQRGLRQVVHVTRVEDALAAARGGARALAHTPADRVMTPQEAMVLATAGTAVITTLSFYDAVGQLAGNPAFSRQPLFGASVDPTVLDRFANPAVQAQLAADLAPFVAPYAQYLENAKANVATLAQAGVVLLAGTDSGNLGIFHGAALHRELLLLQQAGLSPTQVLGAATRAPAQWVGEPQGGVLEMDAPADVIMVEGDPRQDLGRTALLTAVWRRGLFVPRGEFSSRAPASAVVLELANGGANTACAGSGDCAASHTCHPTLAYCQKQCQPSAPATCPENQGCLWEGGTQPGVCVPTEGCSAATQDCPHAAEYNTTCVPLDVDAALCLPPGPSLDQQTCSVPDATQRCAVDLLCHRDGRCHRFCTPGDATACDGQPCRDVSATYGLGVGMCP